MPKLSLTLVGVIAGVAILLFGTVGVSVALENQDSFCASCHTEPESKYYQQSIQPNATTLAAFHTQKKTTCIDCHSGGGILGRAQGLQQGADDLMLYLAGSYKTPAITSNPLGDDSCLKCHGDIVQQRSQSRGNRELNGHYHYFLQRWQAIDPQAAHCVTCHSAHPTGQASQQYMSQGKVARVCDSCHTAVSGEGR